MNINSNSGQFKTEGDTIKLSEQHFKMKTYSKSMRTKSVTWLKKMADRLLQTVQNKSGLFLLLF